MILLDEPFAGIDPVTIDGIQEVVRGLCDRGISFLITDHQVRETLEITDRSYVIRSGKVLCHGTPREVTSNKEARKYYFGDSYARHDGAEDGSPGPKRPPQQSMRRAEW
jgi:lipopolysaccharide export system ATP-binding protein